MVGEVEDSSLVCSCLIGNLQGVVVSKGVGYLDIYVARISVFTVCTSGDELQILFVNLVTRPDAVVEGNRTATVKAVGTIVDWQLVAFSVQGELPLGNTVAIASDERSEVTALGTILLIVLDVVVSQADILQVAVLVGYHDADNTSAEVGETYFHSIGVCEYIQSC